MLLTLRTDRFNYRVSLPIPHVKHRIGLRNEWAACEVDPTRDTTYLYKLLLPNLMNWEDMFLDSTSYRNIEYMTLLTYIGGEDPSEVLNSWALEHQDYLKDIVFEHYLVLVRQPPFRRWTIKPWQWYFIMSKLMRYGLAQTILRWARHTKRWSHIDLRRSVNQFPADTQHDDEDLETLQYMINDLPPYQYYLVNLYLNDYDRNDLERITNTTSSFVYLWRTINDYLKEKVTRDYKHY